MAYTAALNNVYNHYLTTYAPKSVGRYDTHKKSELRNVCQSIVKLNKESPLSIIDTAPETQRYAVGIKENARELHNTIASLGGLDENALLSKKTAYSTNPALADVDYVGSEFADDTEDSFRIGVKQLAAPQVNNGTFLAPDDMGLASDTYSFDVAISGLNYEFQFNIKEGDTNEVIQNRLAKLIRNANIGIQADVVEDENGNSALALTSKATGVISAGTDTFSVSDDKTSRRAGAVSYFGLDRVTTAPANAIFTLNGEEHSAYSNTFTVEKSYEVHLKGISADDEDVTHVGTKPDVESLRENVTHLVQGYNDFMRAASEYLSSQPKAGYLVDEMNRISSHYHNDLDAIGLIVENNGSITVDEQLLADSAMENDAREIFSSVRKFTGSVLKKTNQVALNPMDYVQKTIVAYKNPGQNFATPYITSQYSGMMFNSYC